MSNTFKTHTVVKYRTLNLWTMSMYTDNQHLHNAVQENTCLPFSLLHVYWDHGHSLHICDITFSNKYVNRYNHHHHRHSLWPVHSAHCQLLYTHTLFCTHQLHLSLSNNQLTKLMLCKLIPAPSYIWQKTNAHHSFSNFI